MAKQLFDANGEPLSQAEIDRLAEREKAEADYNAQAAEEERARQAAIADAEVSRQREKELRKPKGAQYLPEIHRLLPQDVESEKAVLSSILLQPREALALCDEKRVTPDWMHLPANAMTFEGIKDLEKLGRAIDIVTLTGHLRDKGLLDAAGGAAYITELFTMLPTAANLRFYLETVHDKWFLRETIKECTALASRAYEEQDNVEELKQLAEAALNRIAEGITVEERTISIEEATMRVIDKINAGKTEEAWGLSTGYPNLDAVARGLRPGNMISIGGLTSSGKTSLALNIIHNLCVKRDFPGLICSLEMESAEVTEVLLQCGSGVNVDAALERRVTDNDFRELAKASDRLRKSKITIRDNKEMSILEARSIARRLKPRIIVLDYAQLFQGGKSKYDREDQEIRDVSRNAKKMAGEVGATVLLLTQLNEDGKTLGSRAITKDADQHWIVEDDGDGKAVKICKQRRGATDKVFFRWIGPAQKFLPKAV